MNLSPTNSASNLKIVKTDFKPSGEAVQLVRPLITTTKSTDEIIDDLVHRFDYKSGNVKDTENELSTVKQAFGSNLAHELIKSYDGSNLVADARQDLVGERYLAEQIKLIQEQQKTTSVLDKWSHLLYEGEKDYRSARSTDIPPLNLDSYYQTNNNDYNTHTSQPQYYQSYEPVQEQSYQSYYQSQIRPTESANYSTSYNTNNNNISYSNSYSGLQNAYKPQNEVYLQPEYQTQAQVEAQARAEAEFRSQLEAPPLSRHSSTVTLPQPQSNLPNMSGSNLAKVNLDDYNTPQFRAFLELLSKPMSIPAEQVFYPPDWPSDEKINSIAEPVYIPAPQPIVIPAPNVIKLQSNCSQDVFNNSAITEPTISYYPSINNDLNQLKNYGIRQLNLETKGSSYAQSSYY